MTRTLTLVVGIAIAALTIAPMALGEGRLAPPDPPSQVTTAPYRDGGERPAARSSLLDLANAAGRLDIATISKSLAAYRDGSERAVPVGTSVETASVDPGRDVDWPQLGIGFGLGILLAIGLGLGVQAMRARPLAH